MVAAANRADGERQKTRKVGFGCFSLQNRRENCTSKIIIIIIIKGIWAGRACTV
ncbi:hypothetical protein HYC85_025801 [Camellia sinensis]|uniref:Uncharacterized protein n=1 Tax=Camellia sinensis TaxID=4442 RepID=A0A7J7GDB5_CAMSI|nr:hypothetical protein HYC85_025801 [Camellia sinensis]